MRQPDPATDVLERLSTEPDVAVCGSEPPRGQQWGDCWCTLDPDHDGLCFCEICTARYGAPGWTPACPSTISDAHATVTCALPAGHEDTEDHGRGWLRWSDGTFWYTERCREEDGTWHPAVDS